VIAPIKVRYLVLVSQAVSTVSFRKPLVHVCTAVRPTAFSQYWETHSVTHCLFFPHIHNTSVLCPLMYRHPAMHRPDQNLLCSVRM